MGYVTYNGLASLPRIKSELNTLIKELNSTVNCDTGHVSDRASTISHCSNQISDLSQQLFQIFKQQAIKEIQVK